MKISNNALLLIASFLIFMGILGLGSSIYLLTKDYTIIKNSPDTLSIPSYIRGYKRIGNSNLIYKEKDTIEMVREVKIFIILRNLSRKERKMKLDQLNHKPD